MSMAPTPDTGKTEFTVVNDDIKRVPSDLMLLKHAGAFYGIDQQIAEILVKANRCREIDLKVRSSFRTISHIGSRDDHVVVEAQGAVAARRVMFLGTPSLSHFGYPEMRHFARRAMDILADQEFPVYRLTTTIHGGNYGLDAEESLLSLILGFEEGLRAHKHLKIQMICFVEMLDRRAELLASALREGIQPSTLASLTTAIVNETRPLPDRGAGEDIAAKSRPPSESLSIRSFAASTNQKRHVFVAMPFSDDFEDVYEYGIYALVRKCGLVCEKTNETAYTGDILQRIKDRIETADLVIADMTGARPNVYLEVGYAWGKGVPVIFLAREGEQLHFDVSRHRCIYYKSIRQLGRDLDKLLRGLYHIND